MTGVAARTMSEQLTMADIAVFGATGAQGGGLVRAIMADELDGLSGLAIQAPKLRKQLGTSN